MGMGAPMEADDEDESSLLAELAALEGKPQPAKKGKPKKGNYYIKVKIFHYHTFCIADFKLSSRKCDLLFVRFSLIFNFIALVSMDEIDRMAASGMADVLDDEINDDDDFDESDLMVEN